MRPSDAQLRLLGLMGKDRAIHLWRLTDFTHDHLTGKDERDLDTDLLSEERVTAPIAPLYFSPRMDCSLLLRYARMVRAPRDAYMLHLEDGVSDAPLQIVICFNQGDHSRANFLARRRFSRRLSKAHVGR